MAAVTVEDCLKVVPNRFELTLIASTRAKQLMNGAPALYDFERGTEKNTVIALREIGANLLDTEVIREEIKSNIKSQSLFKSFDEGVVYGTKKETESDIDFNLNSDIGENFEDDDDSDLDDLDEEEEDDSYYENIGDGSEDISDEELDK